jgi:hypothetical protein
MNRARRTLVMMAALLAGAACSSDPTGGGPPAGTLILRLATPHADDGALRFEVSGPAIDTVLAVHPALRLFTRRVDGSTIVGAVVGSLADGAVVTLHVPDAGAAAGYTARVIEVADRQDILRTSLAGYALSVTR